MQQENLFDQYMDERKYYSFEGARGVQRLDQIISDVCGYDNSFQPVLQNFLEDNPAAIEVLVEYIRSAQVLEWRQNLEELVDSSEEDDTED